jgi:hypothetical protein
MRIPGCRLGSPGTAANLHIYTVSALFFSTQSNGQKFVTSLGLRLRVRCDNRTGHSNQGALPAPPRAPRAFKATVIQVLIIVDTPSAKSLINAVRSRRYSTHSVLVCAILFNLKSKHSFEAPRGKMPNVRTYLPSAALNSFRQLYSRVPHACIYRSIAPR